MMTLVFSAHAEVVLKTEAYTPDGWGILRARGGSSAIEAALIAEYGYSPRTRR